MSSNEVDATSSPQARFGAELARSRQARGWSQVGLARRMAFSNALVSYIERAKRPPTRNFAVKADEVFETGGKFFELWRRYSRAALLEGIEEFAEAEARCRRLRMLGMIVVPGLLQAPSYAQAVASAAVQRGSIAEEQAEERLTFLTTRQRLLERKSPPLVHAVLDESCLARPVGGPEVMAEQMAHLEALAVRPNVTLQVAPANLGERLPFVLPMILLTQPDHTVIGYAESHARGHLERGREAVSAWEREYDQLQVEALSTAASLEMIRAVRKESRPWPTLT